MKTNGHGGNLSELARLAGKSPEDILDFSANINPLGPPEWLRPMISRHVSRLTHYPDPDAGELVDAVRALVRDGVSIDTEGKQRDDAPGGGNLVLDKVRAYLCAAVHVLTARAETDTAVDR